MLRMILGGSAALAIGLIGGWTALTLLPGKMTSAPEQAGTVNPDLRGPAPPPAAAERPARAPTPASPSAPDAATKPVPRERIVLGSGPLGVWTDHTGRGAIEITECAGGLCGHIVWVKDTAHKSECGSQIIGDAKRTSSGAWDGGWIYDPERKARFSVELKPMGSDKLRVMGYQGSKMFNETFTWTRPTSQLKWCDDGPTPAVAPSTPGDKAKPEEAAKVEPTPDRERENPPGGKGTNSVNPNLGDLAETLKFKKRQVNGKWECTVNAPYVGTVSIPCPN